MDTKGLMFPKPKDKGVETIKKVVSKKSKKSERTKATDIPPKVRKEVLVRDKGFCIICGNPGFPNSHYIKKGQGGLGIPQNVVCMCLDCHHAYDNGNDSEKTKMIKDKTKKYLKKYYGKTWKEKDLYYQKNKESTKSSRR